MNTTPLLRVRGVARLPRWVLVALLALGSCASVHAHELSVAHVDIHMPTAGGDLRVDVDLAIRDLALSLPLDADRDEHVRWGELLAARPALEALVVRKLRLRDASGPCPLVTETLGVRDYDTGAYAALRLRARCRSGSDLQVQYDLLFDRDPQHRALVSVHRGGNAFTAIVRADARHVLVPARAGNPFLAFLREGVSHILAGYDHLAFLLALLLPAPLLRERGQWRPAARWRPVFLQTVGLVTAFTLAHSVTLSLAALGWLRPAGPWVEATIAASVVLAALNNVWPLVTRRLWLVALGFGLVHGLGFAGALLESGLPAHSRLAALFGFNVGVELGQVAVVAVALPLLFALRRREAYPIWMLRAPSLAIALLAVYWLVQRLSG